jgi:hypothetical protein
LPQNGLSIGISGRFIIFGAVGRWNSCFETIIDAKSMEDIVQKDDCPVAAGRFGIGGSFSPACGQRIRRVIAAWTSVTVTAAALNAAIDFRSFGRG